jgi:hypothetical protein
LSAINRVARADSSPRRLGFNCGIATSTVLTLRKRAYDKLSDHCPTLISRNSSSVCPNISVFCQSAEKPANLLNISGFGLLPDRMM